MSILRQGNLQITEYFDKVDKQLTLIINKQIMSHSGNSQVINALNDRARENALRVFISGLRRPLCDILFSTRPKDLPTALAVAQELETSHKRYDFASTFAAGTSVKPNISVTPQYRQPFHSNQQNFLIISQRQWKLIVVYLLLDNKLICQPITVSKNNLTQTISQMFHAPNTIQTLFSLWLLNVIASKHIPIDHLFPKCKKSTICHMK